VARKDTLMLGWWSTTKFTEWNQWTPFVPGGDYQRGLCMEFEGLAYWNAFRDDTYMWQAESYKFNADFTEITIKLRKGIMWDDGKPFGADDYVYTINSLVAMGSKGRHGGDVARYVKEATKVDDLTAKVTMLAPMPRYFWQFHNWHWDSTCFPIFPKHVMEGKDWSTFTNWDLANGLPTTTGPYKVVFASLDQKIWDLNPNWWAVKEGIAPHLPNPKRVINVATGGEPTVLTELMVTNQIDQTHLGPDTARVAAGKNPKITTHAGRRAPWGYTDWWPQSLWLNYKVKPFDNPDVRWAISYYIDRAQIIEVWWEGNNAPNPVPWPPYAGLNKYTAAIKDLLDKYPTNKFDPAAGDALMKKAGYTKGSDGLWKDASGKGIDLPITSWLQWDPGSQIIVQQLKKAGINCTYTSPPDSWERYNKMDYVGYPAGHAGSLKEPYDAMNLYKLPDPKTGSYMVMNYSGWGDAAFDKLVDQMAITDPEDFAKMSDLTHKCMEIWLPALPDLPLFNWMHNFGMNETYWTNWPTVDNKKDGEYVNEASQLLGYLMVLTHLEPASA